MAPLIPIETLSFYLSKSGFPKFRDWYKSIKYLEPIYDDLESLTYLVETSTWFEDKLRKDSINKIKNLILKYVENKIGKEPDKYFQDWIDSIQQYCYQGGYGYRIQYSGYIPHHWCVIFENYDKVKTIPNEVALCGIICDKYINLSETADTMIWTN